jgi:type II secretory pathway component PulF
MAASGNVVDAVIVVVVVVVVCVCVTGPVCFLCKDGPRIKGSSMLSRSPVTRSIYSGILIYHFSREWRKQTMNVGK